MGVRHCNRFWDYRLTDSQGPTVYWKNKDPKMISVIYGKEGDGGTKWCPQPSLAIQETQVNLKGGVRIENRMVGVWNEWEDSQEEEFQVRGEGWSMQ